MKNPFLPEMVFTEKSAAEFFATLEQQLPDRPPRERLWSWEPAQQGDAGKLCASPWLWFLQTGVVARVRCEPGTEVNRVTFRLRLSVAEYCISAAFTALLVWSAFRSKTPWIAAADFGPALEIAGFVLIFTLKIADLYAVRSKARELIARAAQSA